ncbi:sedoheptulose 7-phosphate cyclase [Dactylosporangium sp. NPDC000555]|uniref:sedoheptulose 7-phosphate cyclase n=1 Tax=Dactylosporangium sp. NPDC000555 TaxID=3154260 RepID=UPI00331BB372
MAETTTTPGIVATSSRVDGWRIQATRDVRYEIRIRDDVFDVNHTDLLDIGGSPARTRRFVVIDATVHQIYGDRVNKYFRHHNVEHELYVCSANETVKQFETVSGIVAAIDAFGIDRRREPIIAIGGGVLTDMVGLAANLYRRGTPVVRIPTTLIGLVDAGVGVKTGINFNGHKNRLGTYFESTLTLLDRTFLTTLDRRHIANGLAEILKIGLIKDAKLFELLETYGPALLEQKFQGIERSVGRAAEETLQRAIHGMLEELQPNLWETQLERVVDYGHTFSPTIEMRALPALLHGEAVCVDMALTTVLARRRGLVGDADCRRILAVMRSLELPTWDRHLEPSLLVKALDDTVRHRDGQQRLPMPVGIGDAVFVNDVTAAELTAALDELRGTVDG